MPKFSIVIPTRNRAKYIVHTIKTCIEQKFFDDYEIVISDNCSEENIKEVVERFNNDKLRYVKTPEILTMEDNFEFAINNAKGDYLMILGSDDGLSNYTLYLLNRLIEITKEDIISWNRPSYFWPNSRKYSNKIFLDKSQETNRLEISRKFIPQYMKNFTGLFTPMLYDTAVVSRKILDKVKQESGRPIHDATLCDLYSGMACAHVAKKFIRTKLYCAIYAECDISVSTASLKLTIEDFEKNFLKKENDKFFGTNVECKDIFKTTYLYFSLACLQDVEIIKRNFYPSYKDFKHDYKYNVNRLVDEVCIRVSYQQNIEELKYLIKTLYFDIQESGKKELQEWFEIEYLHKFDNMTLSDFKIYQEEKDMRQLHHKNLMTIDGNNFELKNVYDVALFLDKLFYTKEYIDEYLDLYELNWNKAKNLIERIAKNAKNNNIGIYGTGSHTEVLLECYEYFKEKIDFNVYIFDSNSSKWGEKFMGYDIYSPNDILKLNLKKIVISSLTYQNDIYQNIYQYKNEIEIIRPYEDGDTYYLGFINNK